jgi:protein-arginine kinase activator protein McsA
MEMKQAAEQENFERAAELRDKIRALEAEQSNHKESA